MATYFSYADTILRAIYINTHLKGSAEDIERISTTMTQWDRMRAHKTDLTRRNIARQLEDPELASLNCHEAHHYWQTFFYPFLYYMCWLEFRIMMECRRYLRYNKDYNQLPFQPNLLSEEESNTLEYTTKPFRLSWKDDRLTPEIDISESEMTDPDVFCLVDLLEDTTTLFQFKCTHQTPGPGAYSDWVNNPGNKGYKRLYKFLRSKLGKEKAYQLLPVWVQLAFSTTEPIGNFCNVVNMTLAYGLTDTPPAELYDQLKDIYLIKWPVQHFAPGDYRVIEKTPVTFFDERLFRDTIEASATDPHFGHYPLALHGAKWLELAQENADFPYYLIDPNPQRLGFLFEALHPYLTFFNFMDFESRKNAIYIPPDYNDGEFSYNSRQIAYKDYLPEILKKKEIITGIVTNYNSFTPHNCHHRECPYYDTQLCRRWNAIPRNAADCAFPLWFATEFFYEIDLERRCLQRIDQTKVDQNKAAYGELYKRTERKIRIEYAQDEDGRFVLTIPKSIIEMGEISYFTEFLALAAQDYALSGEDFFNKVIFDFADYESDDRFLFEIPEIVRWFHALKESFPHFFLYPSMEPEDQQAFILFPMFIRYEKYAVGDGNSGLTFDPEQLQEFMVEEVVAMATWCQVQQIDGEPSMLAFVDYLKLYI